jgi:hypothetical protein
MDSMSGGQAIGSVIGGVIGGYIGGMPGAMIGMAIGGQIGLMLDPPDAPPPPDWGDLGKNVFVKTSPVPLCYGRCKVYGGVIWLGQLITISEDSGGGKDGDPPSATLLIDFAIGHCEGEVLAYHQYYIDDKTVYEMADEGWHFTFVGYYGTMTQEPNSIIASYVAGATPGILSFVGTAYTFCRAVVYVEGTTTITKLPSCSAEISGYLTENTDAWTDPDANPIRVVYDFMTNVKNGLGLDPDLFNGDPDTPDSPWKYSADYCDELVSYLNEFGATVQEPRFRYSNVFDARVKGYDIITDVLYTCRSLIRLRQGKLEPLTEGCSDFEEVQMYFSDRHAETFGVEAGSTVSRIYGSFSTYPDNYWFGDKGKITISDVDYEFYVKAQTSTYIDLFDDLGATPQVSGTFELVKDNIKEGTFNFKETPNADLANIYRVEYIARTVKDDEGNYRNLYQWEAADHSRETSHVYHTSYSNLSSQIIKTIRMSGIKRKSQAMRMAQYFSDYIEYNKSACDFSTGLEGFLLSVGDLIGISHIQTGWNKKIFRIVNMEETEEDEVKLSFLEYNSFVYNDAIVQVLPVPDTTPQSPYQYPSDPERVYAVQDLTENYIYTFFKRPSGDSWWIGVRIYVSANGGDYMYITTKTTPTFSVKLYSGIDDTVTVIPFDNTTLYGSFPDSGAFWIEDEYITYTSIDAVNFEFEGCVRGANASAHTADKYCYSESEFGNPYITFEDAQIGQTWTIKFVSVNSYGVAANFDDSPTVEVTIS